MTFVIFGVRLTRKVCYLQSQANGKSDQESKTEEYDFDIFSIGGGTGGVRAARWSATNFGGSACEASIQWAKQCFKKKTPIPMLCCPVSKSCTLQ